VKNEQEALLFARNYLMYFPQSYKEKTATVKANSVNFQCEL